MSRANRRAQVYPRFIAGAIVVAVCGGCAHEPVSGPCDGLARDLRRLASSGSSGRELVDQVDAAIAAYRPRCSDLQHAARGTSVAHQLARARIADERPGDAIAELSAIGVPAIAVRRAELFDRIGRSEDAIAALAPALASDEAARAQHALLSVSLAARRGDAGAVSRTIDAAPITDRPRLAHRAAADAAERELEALGRAAQVADLASAVGDRLEQLRGPAAARPARERSIELEPDIAEHWDAVARARIASGATSDALAAWDRASELAPAQPAYRVAPILALVIAGDPARARERAGALARRARSAGDVELLVTASSGAAAAHDAVLAAQLAREARARRASDGRLAFLVAQRLAESGDVTGAAAGYADLLICGAHGKPWHRHEVAARLLALGDPAAVQRALAAKRSCAPVDPVQLDEYLTKLRAP